MVAMSVWPTDASDGSVATEARWRKMGRWFAKTGVLDGVAGEMVPSLAYPNLTIQAGSCWVDGHFCELVSTQVLTVTANGLAVVRFDPAANTADLVYRDVVQTPAQNPTGTWELPIARITGSALTDVRPLARSPDNTGATRLIAWTPIDNPTTGSVVAPHAAIVLGFTVDRATQCRFECTVPVSWFGGQGANDLAAIDLMLDGVQTISDCFTIPFGSGTAFRQCPLLWIGNVAAGAHTAQWRVSRVAGTGNLAVGAAGFGAVYAFDETIAAT